MRSPIAHMGRWWWVELTVVVSIVLMAIVVYRNPTISYDEPFHILAAQSTLRGEGLDVGGTTPYVRAWIYTYLVAGSIALFGDSLTAVRLPSIVATVLLAGTMWTWLRFRAGRLAAWLGTLMFGLSIFTLGMSHFCRFYTLHALAVFVSAISFYEFMLPDVKMIRRAEWALLGLASAALALHLQYLTLVALVAMAAWAAVLFVKCLLTAPQFGRRQKMMLAGAAAVVVAFGVIFWLGDWWNLAVALATWKPSWISEEHANPRYYHAQMQRWYPLLWPLTPLAIFAACAVYRRPAAYLALLFGIAFVTMSLSKVHATRYLFFAMPMLFAVWGMALAAALQALHGAMIDATASSGGRFARMTGARRALAGACGLAIALPVIYVAHLTPAYYATARLAVTPGPNAPFRETDYAAALDAARKAHPQAFESRLLLASPAMKARYYLPNCNLALISKAGESSDTSSVLGDPVRLRDLIAGTNDGLVVIESNRWRDPRFVSDDLAAVLDEHALRIPVPEDTGVMIFYWNHAEAQAGNSMEVASTR